MTFSYDHEYQLVAPDLYKDADDIQIGLYGGWFPYVEHAIPSAPHIMTKSISNKTDANGIIQVDVTVKALDY